MPDFEYPVLRPPATRKPFEEMSRADAVAHLEWFVGQSEPRRALLMEAITRSGVPRDQRVR